MLAYHHGASVEHVKTAAKKAHLSSWHVLEGHVAVSQLTGGDAQAVDVRAEVVALQVLKGKQTVK